MLEEEFLPYEIALIFKELGFNEECLGCFLDTKLLFEYCIKQDLNELSTYPDVLLAPLWQQAINWIREKHTIFVGVMPCYTIGLITYFPFCDGFDYKEEVDTFKIAREQAIYKAIEKIKNK